MKRSFAAVYDPSRKEITMYHVEPTLEWLQKHVGGFIEHHLPQPGVEVYCDEDGGIKQLAPSCILLWRGPVSGMAPTTVTLLGPVVFVFRRARNQAEALAKLASTLKGIVLGPHEDGAPAFTADDEPTIIH